MSTKLVLNILIAVSMALATVAASANHWDVGQYLVLLCIYLQLLKRDIK